MPQHHETDDIDDAERLLFDRMMKWQIAMIESHWQDSELSKRGVNWTRDPITGGMLLVVTAVFTVHTIRSHTGASEIVMFPADEPDPDEDEEVRLEREAMGLASRLIGAISSDDARERDLLSTEITWGTRDANVDSPFADEDSARLYRVIHCFMRLQHEVVCTGAQPIDDAPERVKEAARMVAEHDAQIADLPTVDEPRRG